MANLTAGAQAQTQANVTINIPRGRISAVHKAVVADAVKAIRPGTYYTYGGASAALKQIPARALTDADRKLLDDLLKALFDAKMVAKEKLALVEAMLERLGNQGSILVRAILEVAEGSMQSAMTSVQSEEAQRFIGTVAADITGAFAGAAAAFQLGPNPYLLALGALAGGASGSIAMLVQLRPGTQANR
jgi:hypothetical protein